MLHFVLHDSSNPSTNNSLYLNNLHRFSHPLYLYISFYRPYKGSARCFRAVLTCFKITWLAESRDAIFCVSRGRSVIIRLRNVFVSSVI